MDIFEAVRAQALRSVMKPDGEYVVRHVFRWYSRTFSTPLREVYDIPLEEVLMHYYESWFEDMNDQDRLIAIDSVLQTDADRIAEKMAEDAKPIEEKELLEFAAQMKQFQPKPAIIQGDDDQMVVPEGKIELPPPPPVQSPPEFSMSFPAEEINDNLISDDVENLNSMRQPEDEE